jgi:phage FluMu protein Com
MKNIKEKVAYLQGLAQGLDVSGSSKEGRVINGIIDILEEVADQLDNIEIAQTDLEEYVESIDEDLYDLEEDIFGEDELDDEDFVEVECPKCKEMVCFDAEIADEEDLIEVTCPNCDEVVYVNDQDILSDNSNVLRLTAKKDEDV